MNVNQVIKYPILSEKSYAQMANGVYTFAVDKKTNKAEVKKAVEFIFDVTVTKVNIINYDAQPKKVGKFQGYTNEIKKAIVTLKSGDVINIFPEEAQAPAAEEPAVVEAKVSEAKPVSDAEKKAAEKIAAKAKPATTEKAE